LPFAREHIGSADDIPSDINKVMKEFEEFDFSEFDKLHDKELWVLETFTNEHTRQELCNLVKMIDPNGSRGEQLSKLINNYMKENHGKDLEEG
jgi:hypothetical protein